MKTLEPTCTGLLSRRQAVALLASFGVAEEALAQNATTANPRSYRVVLENERVRVIEYKSRPGLGVCGEGVHSHPAHLAIALTPAKVKVTQNGKTTYGDVPDIADLEALPGQLQSGRHGASLDARRPELGRRISGQIARSAPETSAASGRGTHAVGLGPARMAGCVRPRAAGQPDCNASSAPPPNGEYDSP